METTSNFGKEGIEGFSEVIKEKLNYVKNTLADIQDIKKRMVDNITPIDKKDITVSGEPVWVSTHPGGIVTYHFSTENQRDEFFKNITNT